jgi:hypothetical protein
MLNLRIVPTTHIQQTWNEVEHMLASAMVHSAGEYNLDQLKVMLVEGRQVLLVLVDEENKIQTAFTIEWINHPNERIAFMTGIGGKTDVNAFNQFKDWVKASGGTKVQGAAFESVARLWKRKLGFENRYIIVEYKIS